MSGPDTPPLPEGFTLDPHPSDQAAPPLPAGFQPDAPTTDANGGLVVNVVGGHAPEITFPPGTNAQHATEQVRALFAHGAAPEDISAFIKEHGGAFTNPDDEQTLFQNYETDGGTNADPRWRQAYAKHPDYTPFAVKVAQEPVSAGEASATGLRNIGSMGFNDEIVAFLRSKLGLSADGQQPATQVGQSSDQVYQGALQGERDHSQAAWDQHPLAYAAGGAVGMAPTVVLAPGATIPRAIGAGALLGGISGIGNATEGNRLSGGLAGAAIGGTVGAAAPYVVGGLTQAARRVIQPFTESGALSRAGGILRAAAGDGNAAADAIAAAPRPVNGVQPTLAEIADSPGLAGLQRGHANTDLNTGAALGERHAQNALARTRAASEAMGSGSPADMQAYAQAQQGAAESATAAQQQARAAATSGRIAGERGATSAAQQRAQSNLLSAVDVLGPAVDRNATGSTAREAFDAAYQGAKQRSRDAYADPVLLRAQPLKISQGVFKKLRQSLDDFYGDGGGEVPAPLQSILNDMADPNATTRTLTNIDRRLADFAGSSRMGGRSSEAAFAERVRGDLSSFADSAAPPAYRAALKAAKAVRAEQGRVFESGDVSRTFARDRYGNPATGDNTIPVQLVGAGAPGGDTAERLIQAVGPENAESVVRQEIRRIADERAVQTAAQARALAVRYGEAARRFPAVQRDLASLEARAGELDAANGLASQAERAGPTAVENAAAKENSALHDAFLASPMARLASADTDPSSFVASLLRRSDNGNQLRAFTRQIRGNAPAMAGLRRSLGEFIESNGTGPNFTAAGDQIPSAAKTRGAIATVLDRGRDALTEQQKISLRVINRELERVNFAFTASRPAGSDTASNQGIQRLLHYVPGLGKAKSVLGVIIDHLGNGDEVKQLVTKAVLDPEFAATLLKRPTAQHIAQAANPFVQQVLGKSGVPLAANDTLGLHDIIMSGLRNSQPRAAASSYTGQEPSVGNGQSGQQQPEQQGPQP